MSKILKKGKIFTFPKNRWEIKGWKEVNNNLEDDGLQKIGSYIEHEDYIIGISSTNSTTRITRDTSSKMKFGGDSTVLQKNDCFNGKKKKNKRSIKTICIENVKMVNKMFFRNSCPGTLGL